MILPFKGKWPRIHETAFIAPSADVIGDVEIGNHSSVWFGCVVRGDVHSIRIGERTNIQDQSVLHCTRRKHPLSIGSQVTVGHRVVLHGCTVGDRVLVGMGAVVMDGAVIGDDCIIGAGSLVTQGTQVPSGSLAVGSPARVSRPLKPAELAFLTQSADNYVGDSVEYHGVVPGPPMMGRDDTDLETFDDEEFSNEEDESTR